MKKNQNGFSVVEGFLVLVIIGIIGFVGFTVSKQDDTSEQDYGKISTSQSKPDANKTSKDQSTVRYEFKELGISMELLDGWEVKTSHTETNGVTTYNWTVENANADGKIIFGSYTFSGGFIGCDTDPALSPVTINDVAATQNPKLMFMTRTNSENSPSTMIVLTNEKAFSKTSEVGSTTILNKDLAKGNYYTCVSAPQPGFNIDLNNETTPDYVRIDQISAVSSTSTFQNPSPLLLTAKSYANIKTMMTSIK